jgi:hypothetical protein
LEALRHPEKMNSWCSFPQGFTELHKPEKVNMTHTRDS